MIRTYTDLCGLETLEERFAYLKLGGTVGEATFGYERYLNQAFYRSSEWRSARSAVVARDWGYDLGVEGVSIRGIPIVHHMNPLTLRDIEEGSDNLLNPEGLISCSHNTHNAIHYGDESLLPQPWVERRPGDTRFWENPER